MFTETFKWKQDSPGKILIQKVLKRQISGNELVFQTRFFAIYNVSTRIFNVAQLSIKDNSTLGVRYRDFQARVHEQETSECL